MRAPIPFPSVVIHEGKRLCIKSHRGGVAVFEDSSYNESAESSQVVIITQKQNGTVSGVPREVDMVLTISADSSDLSRIEGRVEHVEPEHSSL